jgi:hypothetical protein
MIGSLIAIGCRALVGAVFVMTAIWKISNRREFESSFERLAPGALRRLARPVVWPLAATEVALSVVLLVGARIDALSLVGPVAAFALVASFTVALALGEAGGCGCWATPPSSGRALKLVPILRNVVLLAALSAATGLSPHVIHGVAFTAGVGPFVTGLILAVLLVEAPQIVAVAAFARRPARAGGVR